MAGAHSLEGLMKWLHRDEWRNAFKEVLDHHLLPACDKAGVEIEEVVAILDQDWFMTTVWGCAFEDFLTRDFDDGRNIVDDYLKRRGWKESASARTYMLALRTSVMSLYEVSDIVPDTSFLARDLVRGGAPVLINERSATRSLKEWDRIAARVLQTGSKVIIGGGLLPFDRIGSEDLLQVLRSMTKRPLRARPIREPHNIATPVGSNADDPVVAKAFADTMALRRAAPMITTAWLNDILDRVMNPPIPEVQNTDGDELVFCKVHFPVSRNVTVQDIRSALGKLRGLRQESATFWNWIAPKKRAKRRRVRTESEPRYLRTFGTTLDDGSIVLGNIELRDRSIVLSANSRARAERGRGMIAESLGTLVGQPLVESETLEQIIVSGDSGPTAPQLDLPPEERRAVIHASLDRHYREQLDEPIPILGNVSPRAAAKTVNGRSKVVAWLKTLENHSARVADRDDPMATYDFSWIWQELDVANLRR